VIVEATGFELEPTPWAVRAACAGGDPDLWFPERGESRQLAKAVCEGCPVRVECLDYAVRWRIVFGVWGGLSEGERRRLYDTVERPRRLPAAHGTTTRYARGCRCEVCREASSAYQVCWSPSGRR
jgi:WhiB family transcriptional regulator, redox-sensing transcriptional regulator